MANPIVTSSPSSVPKYVDYVVALLESEDKDAKYPFVIGGAIQTLPITISQLERNALLVKARAVGSNIEAGRLLFSEVITRQGNRDVTVGRLAKPKSERVPFGYIAEAILQCAVVARLVIRNRDINTADVVEYVKDFVSPKGKPWMTSAKTFNKILEYSADNKNIVGKDAVISKISLNLAASHWVIDRVADNTLMSNSEIKSIVNDSVAYVNKREPKANAEYFYTNGRVDRLEVVSLGVIGQGETKADIHTYYYEGGTNQRTDLNLNISVKVNNVEQFGQATGLDAEVMDVFVGAAGVGLSDLAWRQIERLVPNKITARDVPNLKKNKVNSQVYEIVYKEIESQARSGKIKATSLLDGIQYFMSMNQRDLVVVNVGGGEKSMYVRKLDFVKEAMGNKPVKAVVTRTEAAGNYSAKLFIENNHVLTLSSRETGGQFRNFVSSGSALRDWLSEPG